MNMTKEQKEILDQEQLLTEETMPQIPEAPSSSMPEGTEVPPVGADRLELTEIEAEKEIPQEKPDYEAEIISIVRSNTSPRAMKYKLEDYHGKDIAGVLEILTENERRKVYRVLENDTISDIFEYLDDEDAGKYLVEMDPRKAAAVITEIEPDHAVSILRAIPRDRRSLLLDLLDEKSRYDVRLIASFDEDEIGSRMTTNYIAIPENISIKEAMSELIRQAADNDNISTLFVLGENGEFSGAVDLKELIIARESAHLEDITMQSFPYVYGHENIDDCLEKLKDYNEDSIPVLDNQNRLLGVITSADVLEVLDEAYGEDYARLAGLTAEEDLTEPLGKSMKKRLPWLITLLVLGLGVSTVVGAFERVVARLTIVMAFQSMILDMSGNTGTQSLAVTIRVLTDETLSGAQKLKFFLKELRNGAVNGLIMGAASCVLVGLYIWFLKGRTPGFAFLVSGCIGCAMLIAMIISSMLGTMIPMVFKKLKIDPAVASGPLITTINDFVAVVTYYSLCWVFLIGIFHLG